MAKSESKKKQATKVTADSADATGETSNSDGLFVRLYRKFEKEIKFVLTGGLNTVFDFVIFNVLKSVIGVDATISNIISTSICIAISFYLNSKFVWKTTKSVRETAPGFLVVSLFSAWVVQSIAINAVLGIWGDSALISAIAKLCGSACGMASNYFGYKVIFSVDFKKYLRKLKK